MVKTNTTKRSGVEFRNAELAIKGIAAINKTAELVKLRFSARHSDDKANNRTNPIKIFRSLMAMIPSKPTATNGASRMENAGDQ